MKKSCLNFISIFRFLAISLLLLVIFSISNSQVLAVAGINRTINFQGKLVNNPAATNVSDTSYTVIFTIYDKSSGGTALWTETQSVTTADGIFRVNLGAVTPFPANFNFNWSDLYLGVKVNADAEMTPRVQLAAVPYAFNAEKVSGLTVQDESGNASTSGTLKIPNAKTIGFTSAFNVTIQSLADTTITLPASGTLITNTAAAVQTVTSTQTSGTVLGIADSTGLTSAITGLNIALTSSTNSQNKTGISFDLSGGTGATYYDLLGSGSTWNITRAGVLTVASCSGCGAVAGGSSNWTLDSTLGILRPNNNTLDFLIGGIATTSAKFAFTGLSSLTNQTQASISGQLVVMPNNGYSGKVGIGTTNPAAYLDISGTTNQLQLTNSTKRFEVFLDSSYNVNLGHAYSAGDNILQYNFNYYSAGGYETKGIKLYDTGNSYTTVLTQIASGKLYWVDGAGAAGTLVVGTWENPADSSTFKAEYGKWTISAGSVGLGTTTPASQLHVTRALSAGATGKALAIFDQIENQDILTASASGTPIFTVTRAGGIALGTNGLAYGTSAQCLLGGTTASWGSCSASSTTDAFWSQTSSGVIFANNSTVDFLAGGQSTPAAALRVIGQGNPFKGTLVAASVSANTSFAAFVIDQKGFGDIFAASTSGVVQFSLSRGGNASTSGNFYTFGGLTPTIQSTQNRSLTIGGDKTGNIVFTPNNGSGGFITVNGNFAQIGATTLSSGTGAVSLNGDTTIVSGKTLTLGGMTANNNQVLFAANSTGLVTAVGTTTSPNLCLLSGASIPAWGSCPGGVGGSSNWTLTTANGTLSPNNNTLDFLIGGIATTSAKFAVLNVNGSASPIASLSATTASGGTGNGIVLDSTGSIQTLRKNTLTLGGTTTGNIQIIPGGLSNPAFFLKGNGDIGIGANNISPLASLDIRVNTANSGGTLAIASISGTTSFAGLLIDQRGTGDILTASTSGVPRFSITNTGGIKLGQLVGTSSQCLLGGTTASWGSCGGGGSLFTDAGTFTYLTATADDLILGASTVAGASFYMNVSTGALYLGTNNTGTGGKNGLLTFYSSGNGVADPTIGVDASGNLTISATEAGASVIVGDGSGNISLSLTAAADGLIADKTVTLAAAYSGTDFTFSRVLTSANSAYNMSGAVLYVTDTSTGLSNNTSTGDLILGNAALTTTPFTGNLLRLQTSGSNRVVVTYSGQIGSGVTPVSQLQVTRPLSYGVTGKALAVFDQIENQDIFTASASGAPIFTITKTGGIALGTNGLTFGTGSQCLLGGATATWGSCGAGSGDGIDRWQVQNGLLFNGNQTVDFAIGGTSTASADFIFGNLNGGGGTPTATFSGNLVMNSRPNSPQSQIQQWTQISGTAGTIGGGATTGIASISASVIYNGSLYVGTATTDVAGVAEVYRYNGPTLGTWTKVSGTAGTIGGNSTTGIASVSAMTVFDGKLYVGTSKANAAEIYRYDGGTTWTVVSQGTAGRILTTTLIDGVTALAVYNGKLYAGTKEGGRAELYQYERGTTWTAINTTSGSFVATNTILVDAITSIVTKGGFMYFGTLRNGDADVVRWAGSIGITNPMFQSVNLVSATGSYLINNAASTAFSEITAMTVYNGSIVVALRKTAQHSAEIVSLSDGPQTAVASTPNTWQRLGSAAGTITTGGTTNIDSVSSLAVYNGRLYAGTWEQSKAEIYRYETPGVWTKVSGGAAGEISGATGATTGIYSVTTLQANTDMLYAMTSKFTNGVEVYSYRAFLDQSYSLTFRATPGLNGGVQSGIQEEASIFFLASSSAIANNKSAQNGVFVFTNSITTRNGAYDVAEDYPTRDDTLSPGDLISIDTNERGYVRKSNGKSDSALIGIYSENPALRLSETGEKIDGSKVVPVALVGRVPLKVSTENGKIKSGDSLTSSSIPGVAMKTTKAGVVVAQAMAPYEEDGIGKIMVYVKSNSYNGTTAELFQGIDIASPNFDQDILAKLEQNKAEGLTSEIYTDRLVAGLEIFTPKLVAGEIFAKKIRADQIEGLELLIGKIKYSDSINNVLNSTNSAVLGDSINPINSVSLMSFDGNGFARLDSLLAGQATVSADLNVKGNSMFEGMITVIKSIITPNLIVSDFASFFGDVVFKKNINIEGRPTFNSDTAGFAVVNKGKDTVTVEFDNEYLSAPVITASIALDKSQDSIADKKLEDLVLNGSISYVITSRTAKGFTIRLNKPAASDINFSWVALSVKDVKIQNSNTNKLVNPEATKSAGFQSILKQLEN